MKPIYQFLFISLFGLFLVTNLYSQTLLPEVFSVEKINPFLIPHLMRNVDRKVTFRFRNTTKRDVKVFGSEVDEKLQPIRYLLSFNNETKKWEYPTPNGKPVEWEKVSITYKDEKLLKPDEFIDFNLFFSSIEDCGKKFKITMQIKIDKSKKTYELKSQEFLVEKCLG